jgi:tetratricopeptide (TPR) repeat protein
MKAWLFTNKEWIFSGVGVTLASCIIAFVWPSSEQSQQPAKMNNQESASSAINVQVQDIAGQVDIFVSSDSKSQEQDAKIIGKRWLPVLAFKDTIKNIDALKITEHVTPMSSCFQEEQSLVLYERANDWFRKSLYSAAVRDLTESIALCPDFTQAYLDRGLARRLLNDHHGAIQNFTKVLELEPKNYFALNNRCAEKRLVAGEGSDQVKLLLQAKEDCDVALDLNNQYANSYFNRGVVFAMLGDFSDAESDFERAAYLFLEQGNIGFYELALHEVSRLKEDGLYNPPEEPMYYLPYSSFQSDEASGPPSMYMWKN